MRIFGLVVAAFVVAGCGGYTPTPQRDAGYTAQNPFVIPACPGSTSQEPQRHAFNALLVAMTATDIEPAAVDPDSARIDAEYYYSDEYNVMMRFEADQLGRVAVYNARSTYIQRNFYNEIAAWLNYLMHYFNYYSCLPDEQLNAELVKFGLAAEE